MSVFVNCGIHSPCSRILLDIDILVCGDETLDWLVWLRVDTYESEIVYVISGIICIGRTTLEAKSISQKSISLSLEVKIISQMLRPVFASILTNQSLNSAFCFPAMTAAAMR